VDAVGAEPPQGVLALLADGLWTPRARPFRLAGVLPFGRDVVAALGRDDDVVAHGEVGAEDALAGTVAPVHGRGVDEVDAGVERGADHLVRAVGAAPPVGHERPGAEADLRHDQVGGTEPAVAHAVSSDLRRRAPEPSMLPTTRRALLLAVG